MPIKAIGKRHDSNINIDEIIINISLRSIRRILKIGEMFRDSFMLMNQQMRSNFFLVGWCRLFRGSDSVPIPNFDRSNLANVPNNFAESEIFLSSEKERKKYAENWWSNFHWAFNAKKKIFYWNNEVLIRQFFKKLVHAYKFEFFFVFLLFCFGNDRPSTNILYNEK